MLSLQHCRKILGAKAPRSEEELVRLREQFYCLVELTFAIRDKSRRDFVDDASFERVSNSIEDPETLEERAAIIEFEGNISRDEAERLAIGLSLNDESLKDERLN